MFLAHADALWRDLGKDFISHQPPGEQPLNSAKIQLFFSRFKIGN